MDQLTIIGSTTYAVPIGRGWVNSSPVRVRREVQGVAFSPRTYATGDGQLASPVVSVSVQIVGTDWPNAKSQLRALMNAVLTATEIRWGDATRDVYGLSELPGKDYRLFGYLLSNLEFDAKSPQWRLNGTQTPTWV